VQAESHRPANLTLVLDRLIADTRNANSAMFPPLLLEIHISFSCDCDCGLGGEYLISLATALSIRTRQNKTPTKESVSLFSILRCLLGV
jgi:hypothetical protein